MLVEHVTHFIPPKICELRRALLLKNLYLSMERLQYLTDSVRGSLRPL
jgi:hypothetical protein